MKGEANAIVSAGVAGLHALYQSRSVTPEEAVAAHLDRAARLNSGLNALVYLDESRARDLAAQSAARWRAGAPLSPLDGAPLAVKANLAVKGLPWTAALAGLGERVAEEDAAIVRRLRDLGAIPIGIANMHEGALGATTESPLYGRAQNPLKPGFTPGGSSGGSAAAVAAGFAAFALGTDTMGSVRIPSAYCGIAGWKPTRGFLPDRGLERLSWSLDHVGVHARTAGDLVWIRAALDGEDPLKGALAAESIEGIRVAVLEPAQTVAWEAPVEAAFEQALAQLQSTGVRLSLWPAVEIDLARLRRRALLVCEAEASVLWRAVLESGESAVSSELRALLEYGARQPALKLAEAYAEMERAREAMAAVFEDVDVVVSPAAPHRAFAWGTSPPADQADLTVLANVAGCPAVVTPCGDPDWPSGLHIMTAPARDARALALATAFEKAR